MPLTMNYSRLTFASMQKEKEKEKSEQIDQMAQDGLNRNIIGEGEPFVVFDFEFPIHPHARHEDRTNTAHKTPTPSHPNATISHTHRPSTSSTPSYYRYYPQVLTPTDHLSLRTGQEVKPWTPNDVVSHHTARKSLVPSNMDKLEKMNTLAGIEYEKQRSQRSLARKLKGVFGGKGTDESGAFGGEKGDFKMHHRTAASMYDLGSFSSRPPTSLQQGISPGGRDTEYISHPDTAQIASAPRTSNTSILTSIPTAQGTRRYSHNPDITFDAFLVPHKTGKGEVHRDSEYARKEKVRAPSSKMGRTSLGGMMVEIPRFGKKNGNGVGESGEFEERVRTGRRRRFSFED